MYQSALGQLMGVMRSETQHERKEVLRSAIDTYMTRAEDAKARLRSRQPPITSPPAMNIPVISVPRGHIIAADNDAKRAARVNRPRGAAGIGGGNANERKAPKRAKSSALLNGSNHNDDAKEPPSPAANVDPKLRSLIEVRSCHVISINQPTKYLTIHR
jgi:hypothetical protein